MSNYRPKNHKIELLKDKKIFFVQNYKPLLEQKINIIKIYIDKHLEKKNFNTPSSFIAAAPVLLTRKPDSRLRFWVDYRAFNKIIVKSLYVILLINKILEKL